MLNTAGLYYGFAGFGGGGSNGEFFSFNSTNSSYTPIASGSYAINGGYSGTFVQGVGGNSGFMYGASAGAADNINNGTIWSYTTSGVAAKLYAFTGSGSSDSTGSGSIGFPVISVTGVIYGSCRYGGMNNGGTLWR